MNGRRIEAQDREELIQTTRSLLTEVQALSTRISALNEIAIAINRSLNLDEILRVVGKKAKWLLDFEHCSVCLQNNDGSYRLLTLFGTQVTCEFCDFSDNPISRALEKGQAQLNPKDYKSTFLKAYTSQIFIPLETEQQVIGSINFAKTRSPAYTYEDLRIGYLQS
jgi:transcriptional regulator with GAF, ATPase, and Fis domain